MSFEKPQQFEPRKSFKKMLVPFEEYPRLSAEYLAGRTAKDLAEEYGVSLALMIKILNKHLGPVKQPKD